MDATITHRLGRARAGRRGRGGHETRRRIGPLEARRLRIDIAPEVRRARIAGDRVACAKCCAIWSTTRCATPDGPVDIQATPVAGYRVALTVSDRGPGIADDEKEAVQQRFTRGRAGESLPGSGLGLAIVRSVAVAHGGSLWLQDRPGGGLSARHPPLARHHAGRKLAAWLGAACVAGLMLAGAPATRAAGIPETVTRYPAPQPSARVLTIAGPTDTPVVAPLIQGFQSQRPDVNVVYREMGSRELYEAMIAGELKDVDVLMSSAADLQIRLANDGYAQRYASPYAAKLPSWAVWRNEVHGFTFEPAVIVYNPRRYTEATVPRSRQDCCARWSATG